VQTAIHHVLPVQEQEQINARAVILQELTLITMKASADLIAWQVSMLILLKE
jgi:hypothetical protein